ncbi:MAG TPA: enoyl-CoA hydratase/isomerase family protein [Acidimicrobiales bacterium]|nr:enoyl-CoA hydratase/isomerase family protein [Acidimicrobiales bacterium]
MAINPPLEHTVEQDDLVTCELIVIDGDQKAALLTLARPDRLNAIDSSMLAALDSRFDALSADPSIRMAMITGAGRAFSAGGDLKAYVELQRDPVGFPAFVAELHRVFRRVRELPIPVISLVNGVAAAGGLELMLYSDWCIASESAVVADGHLNFGQMGGGGVLTLLPRVAGIQRAAEMLFTGRFLTSEELLRWGLVNDVVPSDRLLEAGIEIGRQIIQKSPLAVANAKEIMNAIWSDNSGVPAGLQLERERNAYYCLLSHDAHEGLQAFVEKRTPRYQGR